MNIAFSAVLILLLALPGVIFQKASSLAGRFRAQRSIHDELVQSVGAAAIAHAIWIPFFNLCGWFFSIRVDLNAAARLLLGQYGQQGSLLQETVQAVVGYPYFILLYFISICFCCHWAGMSWRKFLQSQTEGPIADFLKNEPNALRFQEWLSELFPGRRGTAIDDLQIDVDDAITVLLSTICTFGGIPYLYVGFLAGVQWDDHGDPERFGLSDVLRRKLSEDETPRNKSEDALPHEELTDRWYPVKADRFWLDKSETALSEKTAVGRG